MLHFSVNLYTLWARSLSYSNHGCPRSLRIVAEILLAIFEAKSNYIYLIVFNRFSCYTDPPTLHGNRCCPLENVLGSKIRWRIRGKMSSIRFKSSSFSRVTMTGEISPRTVTRFRTSHVLMSGNALNNLSSCLVNRRTRAAGLAPAECGVGVTPGWSPFGSPEISS